MKPKSLPVLALLLVGCNSRDAANPPMTISLRTKSAPPRKFDAGAWKLEAIPSYRDAEISVRASMAEDLLAQVKPGTRVSALLQLLDQPNRAEIRSDCGPEDASFFGDKGYLLLSYPVVVEDAKRQHDDLEFLLDRDGRLVASRRVKRSGSIRLGP